MSTKPRVLVLEDTKSEREELRDFFEGMGLEVWPTSSPKKARAWMKQQGDYDLAIVDWDMQRSEDQATEPTSRRVLESLARGSRDTLTIVHAGNLVSLRAQEEIQLAHPQALLHDKSHGISSLHDRLVQLLSTSIGDIVLDERNHGRVVHTPSRAMFSHRIGFRFLTQQPKPIFVSRDNRSMWNGMYRFKQWLESCGSSVRVESMGPRTQYFRLVVREDVPCD